MQRIVPRIHFGWWWGSQLPATLGNMILTSVGFCTREIPTHTDIYLKKKKKKVARYGGIYV